MAVDLSLAKDWIYVLCTGIQTILAIIGLVFVNCWWGRRKEKDERKRADQQRREEERRKEIEREEDRQKADAEKIAAILSENYYEVEDIFHRLKQKVDELREEKIVGDLTEFHVLLYMCRPDNWKKFGNKYIDINRLSIDPGYSSSRRDPRDEILSDVEKIMKFFLNFRIKLFSIMQNKACPDDIKSEFARKITEMGETIYPFVEKHRQDVIERVLRYFVSASTVQEHETPHALEAATVQEHANPQDQLPSTRRCCFLCPRRPIPGVSRCCERQETSGDETRGLTHDTNIEMAPVASSSTAPSNANQGPELIDYPGNAAIENAIPYVECFVYDGRMKLQFWNIHTEVNSLMTRVESGEMQEKEDEILEKINELCRLNGHEPPGGGLLHSIRMVMFKQTKDRHSFDRHEGSFDEFKQYVRSITYVDLSNNMKVSICERMLGEIEGITRYLRRQLKPLLVLKETNDMLEIVHGILDEFMSRREQLLHQAQQEQQLLQQEQHQQPLRQLLH